MLLDLGPVGRQQHQLLRRAARLQDLHRGSVRRSRSPRARRHDRARSPRSLRKRFPQESASVDGILCWDLIDYLDRPSAQELAEQLTRVLRPDGALLGVLRHRARPTTPRYTKLRHRRRRRTSGTAAIRRARCAAGDPAEPRHHPAVLRRCACPTRSCCRTTCGRFCSASPHDRLRPHRRTAPGRAVGSRVGGREVAPRIRELDRDHRFDRDRILGGMAKLGLLGVCVPQEYGGAGHGLRLPRPRQRGARVRGHVAPRHHVGARRAQLPVAAHLGHRGAEAAVSRAAGAGREDRRLRPDRTRRRQRCARASRRRPSRRATATSSPARRRWISLADVADHFLVFAWTDLAKKQQRDPSGISAFIVERAFKGFSSGPMKEKWGILAGNTGFFKMDDVEVPEENMLGPPGRGLQDRDVRARSGTLHGGGRRDGADSRLPRRERAATRRSARTFGVEIGQHQLVKEMIAQMESDYQAVAAAVAAIGLAEERGPAQHARDRPGEVVLRRWRPSAPPATPCRFTAPTATRTSIPSGASTGTARAPSSTRARARFTRSCRPTTCSATATIARRGASCPPATAAIGH